jgi:hypothetical protein
VFTHYEIEVSKTLLKVKKWSSKVTQKGGGSRKDTKIDKFSKKSRFNFLKNLLELRIRENDLFFTLTFPFYDKSRSEILYNKKLVDNCIKAFKERIFKEYGKIPVIWKREFTKKGIPHYHLLFQKSIYEISNTFFAKSWADVIFKNTGADWFDVYDVHVSSDNFQGIKKPDGGFQYYVTYYFNKIEGYQNKIPDNYDSGRFWGFWNKENIFWNETERKEISESSYNKIKELLVGLNMNFLWNDNMTYIFSSSKIDDLHLKYFLDLYLTEINICE